MLAFAALPTVCVQLCLHYLSPRSKVHTALTCRSLLHAAWHPFDWLGSAAVTVNEGQLPLSPTSLLVHVPLIVHFDPRQGPLDLSSLASVPCLVGLSVLERDTSMFFLHQDAFIAAFAHAGIGPRLKQVHFPNTMRLSQRMVAALCALSALDTLHPGDVTPAQNRFTGPESPLLPLSSVSTLTDLTIERVRIQSAPGLSVLHFVRDCLSLRRLKMRRFVFLPCSNWSAFFSPVMPRLLYLELAEWDCRGPYGHMKHRKNAPKWSAREKDLTLTFTSATQLTSLRLDRVNAVDELLSFVALAPALRLVEFVLRPESAYSLQTDLTGRCNPSVEEVRKLLAANAELQVHTYVTAASWTADGSAQGSASTQDVMRAQWESIQSDLKGIPRLRLLDLAEWD